MKGSDVIRGEGKQRGGQTTVERPDAQSAYVAALEMQHASYSDIEITAPDGQRYTVSTFAASICPGPPPD